MASESVAEMAIRQLRKRLPADLAKCRKLLEKDIICDKKSARSTQAIIVLGTVPQFPKFAERVKTAAVLFNLWEQKP